jgi:hypothetical protein
MPSRQLFCKTFIYNGLHRSSSNDWKADQRQFGAYETPEWHRWSQRHSGAYRRPGELRSPRSRYPYQGIGQQSRPVS